MPPPLTARSVPGAAGPRTPAVTTVGHGTQTELEFTARLRGAGVCVLVDVRSYPGSRRHPQFGRAEMERWLADAGIAYRWDRRLGGFRRPRPDSRNVALRHPGFRGYADHMADEDFGPALDEVVAGAQDHRLAVMCSEGLWWRCHRRLLADALVLWRECPVVHLLPDGRVEPHRLTEGVRPDPPGPPVYDVGVTPPLEGMDAG